MVDGRTNQEGGSWKSDNSVFDFGGCAENSLRFDNTFHIARMDVEWNVSVKKTRYLRRHVREECRLDFQ